MTDWKGYIKDLFLPATGREWRLVITTAALLLCLFLPFCALAGAEDELPDRWCSVNEADAAGLCPDEDGYDPATASDAPGNDIQDLMDIHAAQVAELTAQRDAALAEADAVNGEQGAHITSALHWKAKQQEAEAKAAINAANTRAEVEILGWKYGLYWLAVGTSLLILILYHVIMRAMRDTFALDEYDKANKSADANYVVIGAALKTTGSLLFAGMCIHAFSAIIG